MGSLGGGRLMFTRVASVLAVLVAPPCALAQGNADVENALLEVGVDFVEMVDTYLNSYCLDENVAFDAAYSESYVANLYWDEIKTQFSEAAEERPADWPMFRIFNRPVEDLYGNAVIGGMSYVVVKAIYVLEALGFEKEFAPANDNDVSMSIAELRTASSKIAASLALANCIEMADMTGHSDSSEEYMQAMFASLAKADSCLHFDVLLGRYLDIDFSEMTVEERRMVQDPIHEEHQVYLDTIGVPAHCERNS